MEGKVINFSSKKEAVIDLLIGLNKKPEFNVSKIKKGKLKIVYTGGYNGVYDHTCIVTVGDCMSIHGKFHHWQFVLESPEYNDDIECDTLNDTSGFLDFFVDSYIREIGNLN